MIYLYDKRKVFMKKNNVSEFVFIPLIKELLTLREQINELIKKENAALERLKKECDNANTSINEYHFNKTIEDGVMKWIIKHEIFLDDKKNLDTAEDL